MGKTPKETYTTRRTRPLVDPGLGFLRHWLGIEVESVGHVVWEAVIEVRRQLSWPNRLGTVAPHRATGSPLPVGNSLVVPRGAHAGL